MTITSPHNEQLKEIRKLAGRKWRDKLRLFVAEGEDLIAAAARAGWRPEALYAAEGRGLEGTPVAPHVLATVSQLGSGTRALGIYGMRWAPAPVGPLCVALWGVNDPGNVGTVLRSALAFGAGSVALGTHGRKFLGQILLLGLLLGELRFELLDLRRQRPCLRGAGGHFAAAFEQLVDAFLSGCQVCTG